MDRWYLRMLFICTCKTTVKQLMITTIILYHTTNRTSSLLCIIRRNGKVLMHNCMNGFLTVHQLSWATVCVLMCIKMGTYLLIITLKTFKMLSILLMRVLCWMMMECCWLIANKWSTLTQLGWMMMLSCWGWLKIKNFLSIIVIVPVTDSILVYQ